MPKIEPLVVAGVALAAFFATSIVGLLLPALLSLFAPGRKGRLMTRASARLSGLTAEEAANLVAERLTREGFQIVPSDRPGRIAATRTRRSPPVGADGLAESHTYSMMGLRAKVEIRQLVSGVELRGSMWIGDFMNYAFVDSGEGGYIRQVLQNVLASPDSGEREPVTRARGGYEVMVAFAVVAIGLAGGFTLQLDPSASFSRRLGLLLGFQASDAIAVGLAIKCLREVRANPREHSGAGLASVARIVSALGAVAGVGHVALHLFER